MKPLKIVCVLSLFVSAIHAQQLSLNGKWNVKLEDVADNNYVLTLPGTLDDAGIGTALTAAPALDIGTMAHLSRKVQYVGKAYYTKSFTVPLAWKNKHITLELGRVIWQSTITIDGRKVKEKGESLVTGHSFNATDFITPGKKQTISICIDNSDIYPGINIFTKKYPSAESAEMAHAYTNHTQIKWSGVLGGISLIARPKIFIAHVSVHPNVNSNQLNIQYVLSQDNLNYVSVLSTITDLTTGQKWKTSFSKSGITEKEFNASVAFDKTVKQWGEFSPYLYQLTSIVKSPAGVDTVRTVFGIRKWQAMGNKLMLNDQRIFIRGNLECIIFPLTGYPPMEKSEWHKLFIKAKDYGLNTFRFHSWCPPENAFKAADELGFYLQVELPHWNLKVGEDTAAFSFLKREAHRIINTYGNHPSFMFFSMGNELEGDFKKLNQLVAELKEADNRHLYSTTTFSFQKGITGAPQPEDDYYVTQWTNKGWVRGQVVFNDESPDFSKDFSKNVEGVEVPLISHEIGQYSVYPDVSEIALYKGNLVPKNFMAVRDDLSKKGMLNLAPSYLNASGKFAAILYKEEIERALKTKGFSGFQLLQLQDFPGQGTALVGLLNAFWKSKGVTRGNEFKQYCNAVTPLIRFPKPVYVNNEIFRAQVELANFYKPLLQCVVSWNIKSDDDKVLQSGSFAKNNYEIDNGLQVGTIEFDLSKIASAQKLNIEVSVNGTAFKNSWNIWVYPARLKTDESDVVITESLPVAVDALRKGRKVLLCPAPDTLIGVKGKFVPVFWSPVHFPDQPGTMGLLIKNQHQSLIDFPTDQYSNWQWWDLAVKSKAIEIPSLPDAANIVRPIDNFMTNRNLTSLFEAKLGAGKLLFSSINIISDLGNRPQAKQLKYSLLKYMNGASFNPSYSLDAEALNALFK